MVPSVFRLIPVRIISVNAKRDSLENTVRKVHHLDKHNLHLCNDLTVGKVSFIQELIRRPLVSSLTPSMGHFSSTTTVYQKLDCFASAYAALN